MELKTLLTGIDHINSGSFNSLEVEGVEYDSRRCTDGTLFGAISGFAADGHSFIRRAIDSGARFVLFEDTDAVAAMIGADSLPPDNPFMHDGVVFIRSANSRRDFSVIANNFYGNPSAGMTMVGVTGTNGKTSVVNFVNDMLESMGERTATIGTIGNKIGDKFYSTNNTTPGPLELQRLFSEMVDENISTCIMEVSSHSLEMHRVEGVSFDVGVFTNLTPEHLDFHPDMEAYFRAKEKLFDNVTQGSVINIDDPYGERLHGELSRKGQTVLTYGIEDNNSDIHVRNVVLGRSSSTFDLVTPDCRQKITVNFPGRFYVYNVLAAVGAMMLLDFSKDDIVKSLSSLRQIKGRMETVENDLGINIIVDYAHTPDGMRKVLETADTFTEGRVFVVFGCPGERDKTKRPVMGAISEEHAFLTILTDDDPKSEDPDIIISEIESGFNGNAYEVIRSRKAAIERVISLAGEGDTIMLLGKGHETSITIKDNVIESNDVSIVKEILERK